jgi:hypothetical protein
VSGVPGELERVLVQQDQLPDDLVFVPPERAKRIQVVALRQ